MLKSVNKIFRSSLLLTTDKINELEVVVKDAENPMVAARGKKKKKLKSPKQGNKSLPEATFISINSSKAKRDVDLESNSKVVKVVATEV